MKNENLIRAVQTALEKLNKNGVEGWGLNPLYKGSEMFGELVEVGHEYGCTSETCNHVSHDPAAPTLKWIPPEGWTLTRLGSDGDVTFYYLTNDSEEYIIIRIEGGHYHDRLEWGDFEDVPEWMLARLAE